MKSTLALHLACAMACGGRAFGRFQAREAPVLFVSEEDSRDVLLNRAEAMCRGMGWNREKVLGNLHLYAMAEVCVTDVRWQAKLREVVERIRPGLVALDPLAEIAEGDENSNSERRPVVKFCRSLAKPSGAAVMVVAHTGKPQQGRRKKDAIRGASAVTKGARAIYDVSRRESGLQVECLKLSRVETLKPFVVRYVIESDGADWHLARFETIAQQVAVLAEAEAFVLEQLGRGGRLNTSELKVLAKGTGVSAADVSRALNVLQMSGAIDFEPGEKNAKQWGLACLPTQSGQPRQPEILLAGQPASLPGNHNPGPVCLPAPLGASSGRDSSLNRATRDAA